MNQYRSSFLDSIPPVVKNLIIINVLMLLASVALAQTLHINLSRYLGLFYFQSQAFYPHQLITHIFMHGGLQHLIFNMFGLFIFGSVMEQTWGSKRFLTYYMITGIGAGLIQVLVNYIQIQAIASTLPLETLDFIKTHGLQLLQSRQYWENADWTNPVFRLNLLFNMPSVGASGAIFGILLAFAMTYPNIPMFVFLIPFPIKAKYLVIGYGLLELYLGVANRAGDMVGHFAHLGGMLFGIFLILRWRKKGHNV